MGHGGSFDKTWSTGEGNGKPLQYSCLENPMSSMKRQNDRILKEKLPRSVGAQYATGDQWRNNSRKNEGMEPKQKEYQAVDVTGDISLEAMMLKLKLHDFGHLMQRVDSLEKTLMLGGIWGRRRRGQQRMKCLDGTSLTQWT